MGDGDHERTRPPQHVLMVAAIAVLALTLALLAAAAAGPWEWPGAGSDRTGGGGEQVTQTLIPTLPSAEDPPDPEDNPPTGDNPLGRWLIIAAVVVIGVVILLLAVRLALMLRRGTPAPPDPRQVSTPRAEELVDAPAIQEGIAAAQDALAGDRPPRDAIVRAWLALETAAGDAGVARRPSQTPTEFASVVLTRTEADAASVQVLRELYAQSRFSEAEITRSDAEAARAALEAVAASWSAVQVPS